MITRRDLWMKAYGTLQSFALHTSTFGGGSLACAAGIATLDVLVQDRIVQNAAERGRQIAERLNALSRRCDLVSDVRGRGLLMGVEIQPMPAALVAHWKQTNEAKLTQYLIPNLNDLIESGTGLYVMQTLLQEHGIYSQVARSNPRVLRIQPPLTITSGQTERFLEALETTCTGLDYVHKTCDAIIGRSNMGHHQKGSGPEAALNGARPD
jgi:putrescine aminotransferase